MGRTSLLFSLVLLPFTLLWANMAKPEIGGSSQGEAHSSSDIDILHESLEIRLQSLDKAHFRVVYTISSDKPGFAMPLVFDLMMNAPEDFKVWMDDVEVDVYGSPMQYNHERFALWQDSLRNNFGIKIFPSAEQFRYFIVDMTPGIHTIRVEYTAEATVDQWRKVNKYMFYYNLEPARFWKSFRELDLTIDASAIPHTIDVAMSDTTQVDSVKHWHFDSLPQTGITISCRPEVSVTAQFLIDNEEALLIIFFVLMILIHLWLMWRYRKKYPKKKFPTVMFWGSWLVPLLFCFFYMYHFSFIDWVIGEYASRRHGYAFLIFILYPFYVLFYLVVAFIVDSIMKKKVQKKNGNLNDKDLDRY